MCSEGINRMTFCCFLKKEWQKESRGWERELQVEREEVQGWYLMSIILVISGHCFSMGTTSIGGRGGSLLCETVPPIAGYLATHISNGATSPRPFWDQIVLHISQVRIWFKCHNSACTCSSSLPLAPPMHESCKCRGAIFWLIFFLLLSMSLKRNTYRKIGPEEVKKKKIPSSHF